MPLGSELIAKLPLKHQRGSKVRCHLLTHGTRADVAAALTAIVQPFAVVSSTDHWMPDGFEDVEEAQLHKALRLLSPQDCAALAEWWLAPASRRAATPNFDIASTCRIGGRPGLLLIEAKAHLGELEGEAGAKRLELKPKGANQSASERNRLQSHGQIGAAIESANADLVRLTGLEWRLCRDKRYQMSNRFAWAARLSSMGVPVVLVYLGFTDAEEMEGRKLFGSHAEWFNAVLDHSRGVVPEVAWNASLPMAGAPLIPLIRTLALDLPQPDAL